MTSAACERGGGGLVSLVARAPARPLDRLLHRVHREHAEPDRQGDAPRPPRSGPRAASPATYSKCGVSPRITAPSATRQA